MIRELVIDLLTKQEYFLETNKMSNFKELKGKSAILYEQDEHYEKQWDVLPPGIYSTTWHMGMLSPDRYFFHPVEQREQLIQFKSGIVNTFLEEVDKFFQPGTIEVYNEMKLTHKIGYLFYGKPGTGKTCLCYLAMKLLSEKYNAIALDCTGKELTQIKRFIQIVRRHQANPIVLFIDEAEYSINREENGYLPFLDGNDSVPGLIFIGCTNYIDELPARIINRKSRIKQCFLVESLPLEVYQQYVDEKLPGISKEIRSKISFIASEKLLTVDQLKNALIDYRLHKIRIEDAIESALIDYTKPMEIEDEI